MTADTVSLRNVCKVLWKRGKKLQKWGVTGSHVMMLDKNRQQIVSITLLYTDAI